MEPLHNLIASHEDWLMRRILDYAIKQQYAQYTSTLIEPWRLSICGLSEPMLTVIKDGRINLELTPDEDFSRDPIASFGILEAQRHRERGINLAMFLGLFKYYRQSYIDLLDLGEFEPQAKTDYITFLHRFFDRVEIGFCSEWARINETERFKELQINNRMMTNEKNKYLTLFESLANPVILLDHNHCVENINHSAAILLNITSNRYYNISTAGLQTERDSNPIGLPLKEVMPWIAPELENFINRASAYLESETSVDTDDGVKYYQAKFSAMLDVSGKFNTVLIILNDQTEQKLAEERVRLARDVAESANQAKSEFLANMSHELRTPLNAILGFTQLMATSPDMSLDNQENLAIVTRSGQHLLNLINQVLDLSKIESGRMGLNVSSVDLLALLDDLLNTFKLIAKEKQLDLLFEYDPNLPQFIKTDEIKLRQVLINLLNNAIKFTRVGIITLSVTRLEQPQANGVAAPTSARLLFEVKDTGVGIAAEELGSIFDVFVQTQSGRESQEGTGLGMAISQKFIRLMGGDISIDSQVGRGTTVSVEIQAQVDGNAAPTPAGDNSRRITGLQPNQPTYRILVADDVLDNRLLLEKILVPLGFEIIQATNGLEAVEIWKKWQPHLTLMDIRMPVLNGYLATQQIQQLAGPKGAKVIAVSASVFDLDKSTALNIGYTDFLRKPFADTDLLLMLKKHLGVRYLYEEPTKAPEVSHQSLLLLPAQKQHLIDCLNSQPGNWQQDFRDAVEEIDLERTGDLIDHMANFDSAVNEFLKSSLANFRFDILQDLLQGSNGTADSIMEKTLQEDTPPKIPQAAALFSMRRNPSS